MSQNFIVVITGPSGVGKSALVEELVQRGWRKCITCTTRDPRPYEQDGVDYHFLDKEVFLSDMQKGLFMETNQHYGHYYGVRQEDMDLHLVDGHVVVLLNWEGAKKIDNEYASSVVIHIDPPSIEVLQERLSGRNDSQRLQYATDDMNHSHQFQYHLVNDDLTETTERLVKLLEEIIPNT
ncbi:MAG: AAA family ATPase [Pseudomonadota bacterium]|nr:AAA family ATPase [Pseudomonadota bacterium]